MRKQEGQQRKVRVGFESRHSLPGKALLGRSIGFPIKTHGSRYRTTLWLSRAAATLPAMMGSRGVCTPAYGECKTRCGMRATRRDRVRCSAATRHDRCGRIPAHRGSDQGCCARMSSNALSTARAWPGLLAGSPCAARTSHPCLPGPACRRTGRASVTSPWWRTTSVRRNPTAPPSSAPPAAADPGPG